MGDFEREACLRLPLAEASLRLLDFVTQDEFLAELFRQHRGASYEKVIGFPLFVHLIADALLEHDGSGHQSFSRARADGTLVTSLKAMYGKLARVPPSLSTGLLVEGSQRLREVFPPQGTAAVPHSLRRLAILPVDGKKVKYVAKRLKALRKVKGQVLGGKLLVVQEFRTGLAVALHADPDGEASETPLLPEALRQARAAVPGPRLWVADRAFCDLTQPPLLGADGDHWLLRYNAKVRFHPDPSRPRRHGTDARGREYHEEWGWLGQPTDPRRQYVRRITLRRPGDEAVILVTDLLDADQYPAADLLAVYLERWGIERMFQRVTEVFHLRTLIGSTPEATVFQAAFCFLLYNVVVVLRAYIGQAEGRVPETISSELLFEDVQRQLVAWSEVIGPAATLELLARPLRPEQLRRRLAKLLGGVWTDRWQKAPPKKETKHPHKKYLKGGHTSVYRLLQAARKKKPKPAAPRPANK